jgi:hypothetical protein
VQAPAGQRHARPGALADDRLKSFGALSPSPGRDSLSIAQQFGGVTRPFLAVTGSLDGDPLGSGRGDGGAGAAGRYAPLN